MTDPMTTFAAAKLWLISPGNGRAGTGPRDAPYLAHALYALITVPSTEVARMSCDEAWRVYVNPAWLARASVPEVGAELAHLVWHLLSDHAGRARNQRVDRATAAEWAKAADIAISHTLAPDLLKPAHLPTAIGSGMRVGLSTEEYYARLSGLPATSSPDGGLPAGEGCGSAADGIPRTNEIGLASTVGAVSSFAAGEIRRRVEIEYREHVRLRGSAVGDALRDVDARVDVRMPWQTLLAGAVRRAVGASSGRGTFTYRRRSRRASALRDVVLPGQERPTPRIAIVVDTSASVDDDLLRRALAEVDGVIASLGIADARVCLYSVDAAVHTMQRIRSARDAVLVGAGGTDMRVGLLAASAQRPRPEVIIVFTDGDTPWPPMPPPGASVIAALLGRRRDDLPPTPPWATRVECVLGAP